MTGRVVSVKMQKTVVVLIERVAKHPLYQKTYAQSKRYLVDDPIGVKMGDMVEVIKIKPVSRNKHWRIVKVVGKNLEAITQESLKQAAEKTIAEVMPESSENSEELRKPEDQSVGSSDKSDIQSHSESSEKKMKKNSKRSK